eukprot:gene13074-13201_t
MGAVEGLQSSQCDVLVCARGAGGMLQMRMELLAQLWAAGISAELVPKEAPSLTEQYEYAHGSGARWLVILDDKTLGPNQSVRVKSLERKGEDSSMHVSDLGSGSGMGGGFGSSGAASEGHQASLQSAGSRSLHQMGSMAESLRGGAGQRGGGGGGGGAGAGEPHDRGCGDLEAIEGHRDRDRERDRDGGRHRDRRR